MMQNLQMFQGCAIALCAVAFLIGTVSLCGAFDNEPFGKLTKFCWIVFAIALVAIVVIQSYINVQ